jgi:hypothetical protein
VTVGTVCVSLNPESVGRIGGYLLLRLLPAMIENSATLGVSEEHAVVVGGQEKRLGEGKTTQVPTLVNIMSI